MTTPKERRDPVTIGTCSFSLHKQFICKFYFQWKKNLSEFFPFAHMMEETRGHQ